ncbi:hypothetical protein Q9233_008720 [Columba guinea]|nr:hypothetical protein Q9233_008720 [Columba guinea]
MKRKSISIPWASGSQERYHQEGVPYSGMPPELSSIRLQTREGFQDSRLCVNPPKLDLKFLVERVAGEFQGTPPVWGGDHSFSCPETGLERVQQGEDNSGLGSTPQQESYRLKQTDDPPNSSQLPVTLQHINRFSENNEALNIHSENSHRSQSSLGMRDHYCDCNFGNSSLKIQKGRQNTASHDGYLKCKSYKNLIQFSLKTYTSFKPHKCHYKLLEIEENYYYTDPEILILNYYYTDPEIIILNYYYTDPEKLLSIEEEENILNKSIQFYI